MQTNEIKKSIIDFDHDIHAIFREFTERYQFFRNNEYAGFDIDRDDEKHVVNIHYLVHEDHGEDSPGVTKIGKITVDMDDIMALPGNVIAKHQAITDFVHYVIERDEANRRVKEIAGSIDDNNNRIGEIDKKIANLENPASIDKELQSLRYTKQLYIDNVKRFIAERKHVQEMIEKHAKYSAKVIEKEKN
jgi:hypothetical protein